MNQGRTILYGDRQALLERIGAIDPVRYDRTRNYLDGAVTWLSPYITHGIIDTTDVAESVLKQHPVKRCYRLLFELAWREYFHRTWQRSGDAIFSDLNQPQGDVRCRQLPAAILEANTGVTVIDSELNTLYETGLMHNHTRMWLAGVICNHAMTHWREPARWLHYHLLDGDLASNTLSWQWIAGTFSHKRYIANQDNLNRYSKTDQKNTWLDLPYEELAVLKEPAALQQKIDWASEVSISVPDWMGVEPISSVTGNAAVRSLWNLDPHWQSERPDHYLFIDTDYLAQWPMSEKRWRFIQAWLPTDVRVTAGTKEQLNAALANSHSYHREYPCSNEWASTQTPRRWLYELPESLQPNQPQGQQLGRQLDRWSSFSQYWKQVRQQVGL